MIERNLLKELTMEAKHLFSLESDGFHTLKPKSVVSNFFSTNDVMRCINLPEIVELAKQCLDAPDPQNWLKERLKGAYPANSVAKAALDFLIEHQFDAWLLLSSLQQTPSNINQPIDALICMPERRKGLGRRFVLAIGLLCLFLSVFLYLRFTQGN
jgi:hypothetical protein